MKLIGRMQSPFVRRVAVTLELLEIPYEHEPVLIAEKDRLRRYNPMGRVPALVLDDGEILIDSGAIIDALAEMAGEGESVLPPSGRGRRRVLRANALATGAIEKAVTAFYEATRKAEGKRDPAWRATCIEQANSALAALEAEAGEPWICGAGPTIADVTVATALTFFGASFKAEEIDLSHYPALARIAQAVSELPAWRSTAP